MVDKRVTKKGEGKNEDLSDDRILKILYRECREAEFPCRLGATGLFVGGVQEGLGASAAIDSMHLHLVKKGVKVSGLAAFLGKDIGLKGEDRNKKMHVPIPDFDDPPSGIPEPLKEASTYVGTLLSRIENGEITSDSEE